MFNGGCFCGFVRYEVHGPVRDETNCHCSICRRTSGAPFVAWATVDGGALRIVAGEPSSFRSSGHATRTFCPRCGTALTFQSDHAPEEIDFTIASLDRPEEVPPRDHTWVSARLPWVELGDVLPAFPGNRDP